MEYLDFFQHLPQHIAHWSDVMGPWVYVLLFGIIFAETGFVFTPILPGDSLLFAAGALAAVGSLHLSVLLAILLFAAISGDFLNFNIGKEGIGLVLFRNPNSRFFNREHLRQATEFYERHGGKTVIFARFLPIIRTYAPFVAGVSQMPWRKYLSFNVVGAFLWTWSFLIAGFCFGDLPWIKERFHYVILAIVIITIMPALLKFGVRRNHGEKS